MSGPVVFERRPEGSLLQPSEHETGNVDAHVAQQEEHRDDWSDRLQITDQNTEVADKVRAE